MCYWQVAARRNVMIREAFRKSDNGDSKISPGKSGRINEIRTPRRGCGEAK